MDKIKSRKLWLSVLAALLPVILAHFMPNLPTEAVVASVLGALGGVLGISMEDVAKQKRAALEAAALTCLLVGILIGGMLVLQLDIHSGETSTSLPSCQQEPSGALPPIGEER